MSQTKLVSSHSEFPSERASRNFDFLYQKSCSEFKTALTFAYELGFFSVIYEKLSARDVGAMATTYGRLAKLLDFQNSNRKYERRLILCSDRKS